VLAVVATLPLFWLTGSIWKGSAPVAKASTGVERVADTFHPTASQWATLSVANVQQEIFQTEVATEGKIAVDEDHATPVFSPFGGRLAKLLVAPGDTVKAGELLFVVEAADSVQAQNDFMTAVSTLNKARAQVRLTQSVERRLRDLYDLKAIALKDWQQAQADAAGAENDLRSAETALEASRNKLRIVGKTDAEIDAFRESGRISPLANVFAPIAGTVIQRRAGPGQFVVAGSADPVFIIGDVGTVWLAAFVREAEARKIEVGQTVNFTVMAEPEQVREAKVSYVATSLDATSHRLLVRATVDNRDGKLKPEMFANVSIFTGSAAPSLAVPRDAVIYEGNAARVWAVADDRTLSLRVIRTGLTQGRLLQVLNGLAPSDRIVTRGSLFIDRAAGAT
jgi:cobalt-zinc-cadmium efflux system membrane fusion protein